jgi:hypothetical protein
MGGFLEKFPLLVIGIVEIKISVIAPVEILSYHGSVSWRCVIVVVFSENFLFR